MGFFDNFLNAVESGALEDNLKRIADTVDKTSKKTDGVLRKASEKPAELLQAAEKKKDDIEKRVQTAERTIGRNVDIIRKKD